MQRVTIRWHHAEVEVLQGDITQLAVDAIVNAANPHLAGGGGVDGAIHRAGGPSILEECRRIMAARGGRALEPGEAVLTGGGRLTARYIIHTVGPIYRDWEPAEAARRLALCYQNCLNLLRDNKLRSIAFPSISTGAYGYPIAAACPIALKTVYQCLPEVPGCERVIFCTFRPADFEVYRRCLGTITAETANPRAS